MKVSERFRELRSWLELTQVQMAEVLGLSRAEVWRIERGYRDKLNGRARRIVQNALEQLDGDFLLREVKPGEFEWIARDEVIGLPLR